VRARHDRCRRSICWLRSRIASSSSKSSRRLPLRSGWHGGGSGGVGLPGCRGGARASTMTTQLGPRFSGTKLSSGTHHPGGSSRRVLGMCGTMKVSGAQVQRQLARTSGNAVNATRQAGVWKRPGSRLDGVRHDWGLNGHQNLESKSATPISRRAGGNKDRHNDGMNGHLWCAGPRGASGCGGDGVLLDRSRRYGHRLDRLGGRYLRHPKFFSPKSITPHSAPNEDSVRPVLDASARVGKGSL